MLCKKTFGLALAFGAVLTIRTPLPAQSDEDLNSAIESLRADLRADKTAIVTQVMHFTPEQSTAFWPVYKRYEADLVKLNDERVQLIKSYAEKYQNVTDGDAKQMAEKSFDLEARRAELKKKYFKEFNKVLPATVSARFFQLEHRLDLLMDLKLAADLPPMLEKSADAAKN